MSDSQFMHKLLNFLDYNNIDIVEDLYKGRVAGYMLEHLIQQKNRYKEQGDNLKAWLNFIGYLDQANSNILVEEIIKNNK
ncbi:hypothetical protein [Chryseobacterium sp.]|uniref:hypothetical protein n=1 Tax=Chryseobacterium sp. TaxID=1871047 RepID=UPI0012A8B294|nr:hypothetical protein [Chryseobacterium sp.]QFG54505.1 hypothetical protein F7R58_12890 [Chryseobacterium sp.]